MNHSKLSKLALGIGFVLAANAAYAVTETPYTGDGVYNKEFTDSAWARIAGYGLSEDGSSDYTQAAWASYFPAGGMKAQPYESENGYLHLNSNTNLSISIAGGSQGWSYGGSGYTGASLGYFTFTDDAFSGLTKGDIDVNHDNNISLSELSGVQGVSNVNWLFSDVVSDRRMFDDYLIEYSNTTFELGDTLDIANLAAGSNVAFFSDMLGGVGGASFEPLQSPSLKQDVSKGDLRAYSLDFLNVGSLPGTNFDGQNLSYDEVQSQIEYWDDTDVHRSISIGDVPHEQLSFKQLNQNGSASVMMISGNEDRSEMLLGITGNDPNTGTDRDYFNNQFLITASAPDAFGHSDIATAPVPDLSGGLFGLLGTIGMMMFGARKGSLKAAVI